MISLTHHPQKKQEPSRHKAKERHMPFHIAISLRGAGGTSMTRVPSSHAFQNLEGGMAA